MGYSGDVAVGGPPDVRDLPGLRITKLAVGPYDNDVYLLRDAKTGETVLVDGAAEPDRILAALGDDRLVEVIQTHGHPDHVSALAALREETGARLRCHEADLPMMPVDMDGVIADGEEIAVGDSRIQAVHIVGHTPGGLAFVYQDPEGATHLFSGDSLFPGGPGNTWGDVENFARLMNDLETKLFTLPDDTWVYPGHGKDTTLGRERPSIPEWRARGW